MQLELLNEQGQATAKVDAPDTVFARDYNEALVHQIVVAYQANARQGTRAQKDRGSVKHSTKKPFRQKGTGRARAGMTSSPLWRGGGRIFPNTPDENFSHKVNKKMYRAGMASILSQLARDGRLAVVDSLAVAAPKTKLLAQKFKAMGLDSVLVIADTVDENLALASRNLANVLVVEPRYADPLSLVFYKKVLVTKGAIGWSRRSSRERLPLPIHVSRANPQRSSGAAQLGTADRAGAPGRTRAPAADGVAAGRHELRIRRREPRAIRMLVDHGNSHADELLDDALLVRDLLLESLDVRLRDRLGLDASGL